MSGVDKAAYLRLRQEGYRPADARDMARHPAPTDWTHDEADDTLRIEQDGWLIIIDAERDEDYRPELGSFTNEASADAVDLGEELGPLGYRYFLPATTETAHREGLHALGMASEVASETAKQYVEEDMFIQLGVTPAWVVTVRVVRNDLVMGIDAIGGVTFERDGIREQQELVDYVYHLGMVEEALRSAQEKLEELRRS